MILEPKDIYKWEDFLLIQWPIDLIKESVINLFLLKNDLMQQ